MNRIKVRVIDKVTQSDLGLVCDAARLTQVRDYEFTNDPKPRLLANLIKMGHWAPFEFADMTVFIKGCSRVFLAQITRHRLASYMSSSQQYQDHTDFSFLLPESISNDHVTKSNIEYRELMHHSNSAYQALMKLGIDKDDARYVLPNACRVDLLMKANLREWLSVIIPQRICKRNTRETVYIMKQICGNIQDDLLTGPACLTKGKCDQGKMCCGNPYKDLAELWL